jgi:hypothetical protein
MQDDSHKTSTPLRPFGSAVSTLLDDFQCPISASTVRVILNDYGRSGIADNLSRLGAYRRPDFLHARVRPELCSILEPGGAAANSRRWVRGNSGAAAPNLDRGRQANLDRDARRRRSVDLAYRPMSGFDLLFGRTAR